MRWESLQGIPLLLLIPLLRDRWCPVLVIKLRWWRRKLKLLLLLLRHSCARMFLLR
jgi:hypothetical protein